MMDTQKISEKLATRAKELLESGEVVAFIGWEEGRFEKQTTPLICFAPQDANRLIFNEYCVNTLAKYVLDLKARGKIGLCVRGCDARAINRMIQDNQLKREQVYLLGLNCPQIKDSATDEVLDKCKYCMHKAAVIYDEFLGEAPKETTDQDSGAEDSAGYVEELQQKRFEQAKKIEEMPIEARREFFDNAWQKCLRCYACRNVCPCCTCRSCFVDARQVNWLGKQADLNENRFFGLIRAFHISDRCIECGECERACPMDLPLMSLNRKLVKDMNELFGTYESGLNCENKDCLDHYDLDDKEEFM